MRGLTGWLLAAAIGLTAAPAFAEPTTITVRAFSRDAKFIGSGMGGVRIRLVDAQSGMVLAEGLTAGGTGDTDRLVVQPRVRQAQVSGEGDAAFSATLDLAAPTLVRLEATGPEALAKVSQPITVTAMAWVLPGQPVVGDGWVVEFPGLVVEPSFARPDGKAVITAKVTLMCGCPVTPGGLWDADHYRVTARIVAGASPPIDLPLAYAGQASTFSAPVAGSPPAEDWTVTITAVDARTGNTGVSSFQVPEAARQR